jgi:hypothetical protein
MENTGPTIFSFLSSEFLFLQPPVLSEHRETVEILTTIVDQILDEKVLFLDEKLL